MPAPRIYLSHRTHPFGTAGYDAITVLATVLGSGRGSRLYQRLADGSRIAQPDYIGAYGVDLAHAPGPADHHRHRQGRRGRRRRWRPGLAEVVDSLATEPVTEAELDRAKALLTTAWWRQLSTVGGRADTLGRYATQFGDPATRRPTGCRSGWRSPPTTSPRPPRTPEARVPGDAHLPARGRRSA